MPITSRPHRCDALSPTTMARCLAEGDAVDADGASGAVEFRGPRRPWVT